MKNLLAALLLLLVTCTAAHALTIDYEHVSGYKAASPPYGIFYSYDIGFIDNALRIDVDIFLSGATQGIEGLKNRWETGIESIWSTTDRFKVPILFNVDWVTSTWDHAVRVVNDYGRWDTYNWYTKRADDNHESVAAHEYGHYLSLFDEYRGGGTNPATLLTDTGGLMHTLSCGTLDYYYDPFLDWYEGKMAAYDGGDDPVPTPEPSTFLLLGAGLMAVALVRRRQAMP